MPDVELGLRALQAAVMLAWVVSTSGRVRRREWALGPWDVRPLIAIAALEIAGRSFREL